ncbi:MAG: UDPglucose--hexose-phosphate uridylyltransferase [Thermoproteota archaeon]|nr:UDPglucose--hexose-phosphate uridylyltransferase [Thermoproteota archaeon]
MGNEVRKDYLLNRYVIIASQRAKRPSDIAQAPSEASSSKNCPFCPGNEHITPPADLVYLEKNNIVIIEKDREDLRHREWLVRCFENLYPALSPHVTEVKTDSGFCVGREVYGYHEIIVESPDHLEQPSFARLKQLELMFDASLELLRRYYNDKSIEYVQIFRNYRREAGASLSHPHTQIIASSVIPSAISTEFEFARKYYKEEKRCVFCSILEDEERSPRLIYKDDKFTVIAPWASIHPYEFWIIPRRHESDILDTSASEKNSFARTLRLCLGSLTKLLGNPPYNYGFHINPKQDRKNEYYHWHLEVYPKLSIWGGFELSTGMYINITPPELAAEWLREEIKKEESTLAI